MSSYTRCADDDGQTGAECDLIDDHGMSVDESEDEPYDDLRMNPATPKHAADNPDTESKKKEPHTKRRRGVRAFVIAVSVFLGVIIMVTQLNFYHAIEGLTPKIAGHDVPLWAAIPFAVEGLTWAFGMMATQAVREDKGNEGKYLRWMWIFAFAAAGVNIWHNVAKLGDLATGIVLGAFSLSAPFLWHTYVGLTVAKEAGRSASDVRQAARTRILHPYLSYRAARIHTYLQTDHRTAWQYALVFKVHEVKTRVKDHLRPELDKIAPPVSAAGNIRKPQLPKKPTPAAQPRAKARKPAPTPAPVKVEATPANTEPRQGTPAEIVAGLAAEAAAELTSPGAQVIDMDALREKFSGTESQVIDKYHELLDKEGKAPSFRRVDRECGTTDYAHKILKPYLENQKQTVNE